MEYVQMTLTDWMSIKNELEQELRNAAAGFVRIGYLLRRAEESEGYKNDGYDTLTEWAQENYGLTPTQVSRFKAINKRYSIDGYSGQLRLEYANYGQSKLTEMLTLSDEGMEMVSPAMRRDDIREIKAFERQAPKEEPVQEWIKAFVDLNVGIEELKKSKAYRDNDLQGMIKEINPAGARTFRTGRTMVSMLADRIMVREFPNPAKRMEWSEFFEDLRKELDRREQEIEVAIAREEERKRAEEEVRRNEEEKTESAETGPETEEDRRGTNVPKQPTVPPMPKQAERIAPAQKEPADIVIDNVEQEKEEPEQVEIAEILPAPTTDKITELKERFGEALNTLRVMLDAGNYKGMDITIDRLKGLRAKLIEESIKEGES